MKNITHYLIDIITLSIPRLLGLIDRTRSSPTYGCCERYFWHYKLTDFVNIRFQETCWVLALLYKNEFENNFLFNSGWCKNLIEGILNYSVKLQRNDGSFDELYPYEKCFCATSFFTVAMTETLLLFPEMLNEDIKYCLKKTGGWLSSNSNPEVTNQEMASCRALINIFKLTGIKRFEDSAIERLNSLTDSYNKHGYFIEYGGFDAGYNSITLGLLVPLIEDNYIADKSIEIKLREKITGILDESGCYDYTEMSRRTNYLYLSGLIKENKILEKITNGLQNNRLPSPMWMDDRYLIPFLTDYILAYIQILNK